MCLVALAKHTQLMKCTKHLGVYPIVAMWVIEGQVFLDLSEHILWWSWMKTGGVLDAYAYVHNLEVGSSPEEKGC